MVESFDAMMIEALEGTKTHLQVDICRLAIHELKDELCFELKGSGKEDRVKDIEKFFQSHEVFEI